MNNAILLFFCAKACVRCFLTNFHFSSMIALQKLWKMFLFHLKSSFLSPDIHIFVFPSSTLFLPVSYCFRAGSKINLKVYDVINGLNENLITHFVWNLEKEKQTFIFILVNNPKQSLHTRNFLKNKISWKRIIKNLF